MKGRGAVAEPTSDFSEPGLNDTPSDDIRYVMRIAKLEARINDLELALHTIVGHGNITVERAKLVAANALAKN